MTKKAIDLFSTSVQSLAAAGADQAGAAAITCNIVITSGADDSKGVRLPAAKKGLVILVVNRDAAKAVKVYPPTGGKINAGAANAAVTLAATKNALYVCDGTDWDAIVTA